MIAVIKLGLTPPGFRPVGLKGFENILWIIFYLKSLSMLAFTNSLQIAVNVV